MRNSSPKWTGWRIAVCAVGGLLLLGALVAVLQTPGTTTFVLQRGASGAPATTSTDLAKIIWPAVVAALGIAAIIASFVLPRRDNRAR